MTKIELILLKCCTKQPRGSLEKVKTCQTMERTGCGIFLKTKNLERYEKI